MHSENSVKQIMSIIIFPPVSFSFSYFLDYWSKQCTGIAHAGVGSVTVGETSVGNSTCMHAYNGLFGTGISHSKSDYHLDVSNTKIYMTVLFQKFA